MHTTESPAAPMLKRELPDPTRRNRFFFGKLMDAYHFELETNYLNAKRWLLNRLVSGCGVVCGLDVQHHGEQEIVVTPGVAIDRWGREIIVQAKTAPLAIPVDLVKAHAEWHKKKKRQEECCIHVVICYHECLVDPTPVLAEACGCDPVCAPGAIRERYCIEFRPGCAPPVPMVCHFDAASRGTIDYNELVEWVTRKRRCLDFPKDPCIPLANFPVDVDSCSCCRGPEDIDITIRPIVFYNRLLFDLLYCLETEGAEAETE
jgi:hypothetical protein